MPRKARERKPGAVYHVLMRGREKKALLKTPNDYEYFLSLLRKYREDGGPELYGFCLLPDHVHLVVREGEEPLGCYFRKLATAYACHYNLKHKRAGHVFQDRCRSVILSGPEEIFLVLSAIHTEPVRAGLCPDAGAYPYSSLGDYLNRNDYPLTDTAAMKAFFPEGDFDNIPESGQLSRVMEPPEEKKTLTDKQAEKIMKKVAHAKKLMELPVMSRKVRNAWLRRLRREGMSVTQISRFTGLGRNIVSRACSENAAEKKAASRT